VQHGRVLATDFRPIGHHIIPQAMTRQFAVACDEYIASTGPFLPK
jgi:hypothetical protein